ncbi:hypothetical protein BMB17_005267, partial [Escherichia coli]|nr:hypothetical protein [Escherichia coli]
MASSTRRLHWRRQTGCERNYRFCNYQAMRIGEGLMPDAALSLEQFLPYRLNRLADAVSR